MLFYRLKWILICGGMKTVSGTVYIRVDGVLRPARPYIKDYCNKYEDGSCPAGLI